MLTNFSNQFTKMKNFIRERRKKISIDQNISFATLRFFKSEIE